MNELKTTSEESILEFMEGFRLGIDSIVELFEKEMVKVTNKYFHDIETGKLKKPGSSPETKGIDYTDIGLMHFMITKENIFAELEKLFS